MMIKVTRTPNGLILQQDAHKIVLQGEREVVEALRKIEHAAEANMLIAPTLLRVVDQGDKIIVERQASEKNSELSRDEWVEVRTAFEAEMKARENPIHLVPILDGVAFSTPTGIVELTNNQVQQLRKQLTILMQEV